MLVAFLEKDNLKLLAYKGKTRVFAGQISFSTEVVRDGFIADSEKFAGQVKVALSQKSNLGEISEALLFLSPDKTFIKTLPTADSPDGFIRTLPYFNEELVVTGEVKKTRTDLPAGRQGSRTTYVAIEKKLVEDFQRPFLDMGKKVVGVKSGAAVLASKYPQSGKYFLTFPLEKEIVVVVCENGEVLELGAFKLDVFASQLPDFIGSHNLAEIKNAFTLGIFSAEALSNVQKLGWNVTPLESTDIYDLMVLAAGAKSKFSLPDFKALHLRFPGINPKYLSLAGAIFVGFALVVIVVRNLPAATAKKENVKQKETQTEPVSLPQPKPGDYALKILNGTLVTGEAGRAAEKLKNLGFEITETKNATSAGFSATRIRPSKSVPEKIVAEINTVLLETYQSTAIEPISDSSVSGKLLIEIIIGAKKE